MTNHDLRGSIAIVGIGETEQGRLPGRDHWDLSVDAALRAVRDAGLTMADVDGLITGGSFVEPHAREHLRVADMLGMGLRRYTESSAMGGSGGAANLRAALAIINAGLAHTILVVGADPLLSASARDDLHESRSEALRRIMSIHDLEHIEPYGPIPAANMALIIRLYMEKYGWTREQFAEVAVTHREHAIATPGAVQQKPITVADVLAAPMIADPIGRLDCSIVTDGGVAYVVTTAERAKDLKHRPAYVLGASSIFASYYTPNFPDLMDYPAAMIETTSDEAFAMAGVERSDIDVVSVPDVFTGIVPIMLEHTKFCAPGEAGPFVGSGMIRNGAGALPVNTHGGNLAYTHPGNSGQTFNLVELVKQLRNDQGARQVPDAELGFIHSFGGTMAQHTSVVLSNSR